MAAAAAGQPAAAWGWECSALVAADANRCLGRDGIPVDIGPFKHRLIGPGGFLQHLGGGNPTAL
jgi:hypothetical protein